MKTYSDYAGDKWSARTLQAWNILIHLAQTRSTIQYEQLADLMGFHPHGGQAAMHPAARIQYYCRAWRLPLLNTLVVNKGGRCGRGEDSEVVAGVENEDAAREEVYKFGAQWWLVHVTIEDIQAAYKSQGKPVQEPEEEPQVHIHTRRVRGG
jgi:hypothetical protein